MSNETEQEIRDKGLTAPRVTPEIIEDVCGRHAPQFYRFPGTTVTVCCLELANGFNVTGESACASIENFDQELGERLALKQAKDKVWALEGYALRNILSGI
jgi:hypothetical protein